MAPLDPRILDLLGEFPRELFDERFYVSWELVYRYGQQWAVRLARDLGLEPELQEPRTADELIARTDSWLRRGRRWSASCASSWRKGW